MKRPFNGIGLLLLALVGVGRAEPLSYACSWEGGRWNKLMDGTFVADSAGHLATRPERFDTRFAPAGTGAADAAAKGPIGFYVVCNGTGLLLAVRIDEPDVAWLRFFFQPVDAAPGETAPPYELAVGMRRPVDDRPLVPFGVPLHFTERTARYAYPVVETPVFSPSLARQPLRAAAVIRHVPQKDGGRWVSCFLPWGAIPEFAPGIEGVRRELRLGIACDRPEGALAWGGADADAPGGVLKLPAFSAGQHHDILRSWLTLGANPGERHQRAVERLRGAWTLARRETAFGDPAASASSWEKGSANGDTVFFERIVEPLLARNAELAKGISKPQAAGADPPVLSMDPGRRRDHLEALPRLLEVLDVVERERRAFLMDRLFNRPLPERNDPSSGRSGSPEEKPYFDLEIRNAVDIDSLLEEPAL